MGRRLSVVSAFHPATVGLSLADQEVALSIQKRRITPNTRHALLLRIRNMAADKDAKKRIPSG
jgi:hypothetical protein